MEPEPCSILTCPGAVKAKGYCSKHYECWRKYGNALHREPWRSRKHADRICRLHACGRAFEPTSARQNYCTPACRMEGLGGCTVVDGTERCDRAARTRGMCGMHYNRTLRMGQAGPLAPLPKHPNAGKSWRNNQGYLVVHRDGRDILEHRYLFELVLGRPLLSEETVHHCNNQPDDNRTDGPVDSEYRSGNLQLWSGSQPPGGRVVDLVGWAVELLERYAPELLAAQPVQLRLA